MAHEQQDTEQPVKHRSDEEGPPSLMALMLGFLIVVGRHRSLVLGLPALAGMGAVIVSLMMPPIYTSTAKIMPANQQNAGGAAMLGQLSGLMGGVGTVKNNSDIYVGMLQSRTVADSLIKRFELKDRYEVETMDEARKALQEVSKIASGKKDGMISITVSDKDPKFAAELANAYVDELMKLSQTMAISEAALRRLFFEKQLIAVKDNLANAEVEMQKTQEKTGVISPDGQVGSLIASIAQLRGMISAKEVQLKAMQTYATGQHPDLMRAHEEVRGLRAELAKLERNQVGKGPSMLSTGMLPEAGVEYVRAMRNVKYYETMFEMLAKQYELARIDESKDASTIQLMDLAVPAEIKSKPRRAAIVLVTVFIASVVAVLIAYVLDGYRRFQAHSENRALWRQLSSAWRT